MGDGDKHLDLTYAQANNGQWHVLRMERYGHEFHLRLDGGEGMNYNYTLRSGSNREREVFKLDRRVYSGAYKQGIGLSSVLIDDLVNCKFEKSFSLILKRQHRFDSLTFFCTGGKGKVCFETFF